MKRFSFSTYQVNEFNRKAFDACKAISEHQPVSPMPVVIVADDGAGKTHLLYSIVNQVRASSAKTGLAYVTAKDFPTQVRILVKDPSPVQRAKSAILLVDQLEDFDELADELEAVVKIFLDSHHYVVFASSVHPGRLKNLPEGLRALLDTGQVLHIKPQGVEATALNPPSESDPLAPDLLDDKDGEVRQLRVALEKARAVISAAGDAEEVRHALEMERARTGELESDLEAERKKAERARKGFDKLRGEVASLKSAAKKKQKGHAAGEQAADAETEGLREQLSQAAQETEQAKREATEVGKRAGVLLEKFESNRAAFEKAENEHREQVEVLQNLLDEHKTSATQFGTKHGELESQLTSVREELETVTRSRDEAIAKLNALAATSAEKDQEMEKLRTLPALHEKKMEALQREAAEQVAAANAHGGKIEHNLKQATAALEGTKQNTREAINGLRGLTEQLGKTTTILASALTEVTGELEKTVEKEVEFVPVDDFDASATALSDLAASRGMPPMEDSNVSEIPGLFSPGADPLGLEMDASDPFGAVPLDIDAMAQTTSAADPLGPLSLDSEVNMFDDVAAAGDVVSGEIEGVSALTPDTVLETPPTGMGNMDDSDTAAFSLDDDPLSLDDDEDDPLG